MMTKVKLTPQQEDIELVYENAWENIRINAGPGSGKTWTLLHLVNKTKGGKNKMIAFNKSIADELKRKVKSPNFDISTIHSVGAKCIHRYFRGKAKLTPNKTVAIAKMFDLKHKFASDVGKKDWYPYKLSKAVDFLRLNFAETEEDIIRILNYYGISFKDDEELYDLILLYNKMNWYNKQEVQAGRQFVYDFSDMIYLPLILDGAKVPQYDRVFIDEAQDLSVAQHRLLKMMLHEDSRLVSVGDPKQMIYSFTGASPKSFDMFLTDYGNTFDLPLSVSFRCSEAVIEYANDLMGSDYVQPFEGALEGDIIEDGNVNDATPEDFVLCRNNAPLIFLYLKWLGKAKPCFLKGNDMSKKILSTLSKNRRKTKDQLFSTLDYKTSQKRAELLAKKIDPDKNSQFGDMMDLHLAIKTIVNHCQGNVSEALAVAENMFEEKSNAIMLSTIHKSKGLECRDVYWLAPDLLPSKYAKLDWELEAEKCLEFVLVTRAKRNLVKCQDY